MAARAPKKLASLTSPVKKKRVRSEEGQRAKRESDKRRSKTRITIGAAITKWQQVKKRYGIKTDPKMAFILLDRWVRQHRGQGCGADQRYPPPRSASPPNPARKTRRLTNVFYDSSYLRTKSESRPERPSLGRTSSTETR